MVDVALATTGVRAVCVGMLASSAVGVELPMAFSTTPFILSQNTDADIVSNRRNF